MWNFVRRAVRRNYGQDKEYYRIIDELFGFVPHNIELYKLALIHKSASLVLADGRQINNERLEFLGDAVIEAVTSDYLYHRISRPAGGISYAVALEDRFAPVAQYDRPDDRVGPVRDRQPDRKHQPETYLRGCFRSDDRGDLPRSGV